MALLSLFVVAVVRGGVTIPASFITGVTFVLPAWWFVDLALRRRWFLRVTTHSETRKLVFRDLRDEIAIVRFVSEAKQRFGYV